MEDPFADMRRERETREEQARKKAEAEKASKASMEQITEAREKYKNIIEPVLREFANALTGSTALGGDWAGWIIDDYYFYLEINPNSGTMGLRCTKNFYVMGGTRRTSRTLWSGISRDELIETLKELQKVK